MSPSAIVPKLWNYCNVLRDDGMSYGDYPSARLRAGPSAKLRTGVEQLTYLLFLKMPDERAKPPYLPAWRMYSVLGRMQHHPWSCF